MLFQVDAVDGAPGTVKKNISPCKLDNSTHGLIKLIFDNDMFKEAMANMDLGRNFAVCLLGLGLVFSFNAFNWETYSCCFFIFTAI